MNEADGLKQDETSIAKPVVRRVLNVFVDSLSKEEGMSEVAARLRTTLLDQGSHTEASLKAALFGDSQA